MLAGIIRDCIFLTSFIYLFYCIFTLKKSSRCLSAYIWLLLTLLIELCWGSVYAGVIGLFRIPVNQWSMSVCFVLSSLYLSGRRKERQEYYWERFDTVVLALVLSGASVFFLLLKGIDLQCVFRNIDAAVHFENTMLVHRSQSLSSQYFIYLWNALFIEFFSPFIPEIDYYKIFMIEDMAWYVLELLFFVAMLRDGLKDRPAKVMGLALSVVYALGLPLNSYLYSFIYWGVGVMLIGFVALLLKYYRENVIDRV